MSHPDLLGLTAARKRDEGQDRRDGAQLSPNRFTRRASKSAVSKINQMGTAAPINSSWLDRDPGGALAAWVVRSASESLPVPVAPSSPANHRLTYSQAPRHRHAVSVSARVARSLDGRRDGRHS